MIAPLSRRARRDLLEAGRWIARDNPAAARRLRTAILETARRIGGHPGIGAERPRLAPPPHRFVALGAFPYLVVYLPGDTPRIVRIVHTSRDLPAVLREED